MINKKTISVLIAIITAAPIIGGILYVWKKDNKPTIQTPPQQIAEPKATSTSPVNNSAQGIVYHNDQYDFSLTFPEIWTGFVTKNRTIEWDEIDPTDSIDIGFPEQDSLFNISVFTKTQWQALQSKEGIKPIYIGENNSYVFAYDRAQYAENQTMAERMKDVPEIISTFIANNSQ